MNFDTRIGHDHRLVVTAPARIQTSMLLVFVPFISSLQVQQLSKLIPRHGDIYQPAPGTHGTFQYISCRQEEACDPELYKLIIHTLYIHHNLE